MENFTDTGIPNASQCHPEDSAIRRRAFAFFYLVIILSSIPLNSFFLYVSWQHIRQKNELGVYLLNLALCDLTFTLGLSLWLDFLWRGLWAHKGLSCIVSIYCLFTNFYASEGLLCCIALDRYLAVVHPFKYKIVRRVSTAVCVSSGVWVLVLIFNAASIFSEYNGQSEDSLCHDILQPLTAKMARLFQARFVLGFALPLSVVLFSAWGIFGAVRKNRATQEQELKSVTKLLLMVSLCLVICFGPVHVLMLVRTLVKDCQTIQSLLYPHKVSIAVSCLNCLADPLLYCFVTRTGKAKLHQVVLYFQGRRRTVEHGESVSVPVRTWPGVLDETHTSPGVTVVTL